MKLLAEKLKFYLVLETKYLKLPLGEFLEKVIKGGVTAIQLRNKGQNKDDKLKDAYIIREIADKFNVLFIVNDDISIAIKSGADGVHLGAKDGDISLIRKESSNIIIGYSCNNFEDVNIANKYADYTGIGPFTNTFTKKDHRQILGEKGTREINSHLNIPAVAIGGINLDNARVVMNTGVSGVAISSYLCMSHKPYDNARKLLDILNERV